ncbi:MAG: hypothetical protein H8F28_26895 [Fibrella sp.]|nr:hypothetical protein [Armatimonadota bacterium]
MRFNTAIVVSLLALGVSTGGCENKEKAPSAANKEAFTGPAMPEEARVKMRDAQAKAMSKAGAGAPPPDSGAPPQAKPP